MTYHVLFNPHAGNGRGTEAAQKLNAPLPDDALHFYDITEIGGYGAFFAALPAEDRVVIAGGDGTLNRFINDTASLRPGQSIYYFATGSGNDFFTDIGGKAGDAPRCIDQYLTELPSVYVEQRAPVFSQWHRLRHRRVLLPGGRPSAGDVSKASKLYVHRRKGASLPL